MSSQENHYLTPEEYLDIERKAEYKSEYHDGEMFAMCRDNGPHNLIDANLISQLVQQLRPTPCRVYTGSQRVLTASGAYTYPDIVVACDEPRYQDDALDTLLNPILIVEVLSSATEAYDRGEKFAFYRTIEGLKSYLVVSSEDMTAELWELKSDGYWHIRTEAYHYPEETIEIESVGCRLKLSDIYDKVEFPKRGPATHPVFRRQTHKP